jgi:hypothetical protein
VLNEFYRVASRKKVYRSIDELQADLDGWITEYNEARPYQGRWCFGKTPMQTFSDAMPMTKRKMIAAQSRRTSNPMLKQCGRFGCLILCHAVTMAVLVATSSGSAAAQKISDQDPTLREYQGTVEPVQKFVFSARFDGLLSKINFDPGQVVKEGEIVRVFTDVKNACP